MRGFKALFDFYIQSSVHVAFAIYALVCITEVSLQLPALELVSMLVFFGTIVGYNFLKYFEAFQNGNFDFNKNRYLIGLTLFSISASIYYFLQLPNLIQIYFIKIGLWVVIYPFLRKFGFLKLFWVSFCVTGVTAYALVFFENEIKVSGIILIIQRFLIVVSLLIPFEILDTQVDDDSMKTLPQRFGIFKTKLFGICLLFPFVMLEFLKEKMEISTFVIAIITALFIGFTNLKRDKYYTSFWVESVPIIWWVLLYYT